MKKRLIIGISVLSLFLFSACDLFGEKYEDINSLTFNNNGLLLEAIPDYEMRTLSVVYDAEDAGIIGGDFFDRAEEILGVWVDSEVEKSEGNFIFSIYREGGEVNEYFFDLTDTSEEFLLLETFYTDVSELFNEDVY